MDELEKLMTDHRDSFDRLEPAPSSWEKVKGGVAGAKNVGAPTLRRNYSWLAMAAAVTILAGLAIAFSLLSGGEEEFAKISMYSPQGEEIALDPAQNNITLVQFWESGNVLCVEENCYYFLPAYEKYKDQGFEIYAISLDEDKESWTTAIEENKLPWIHVSDLLGWESPVCEDCNVTKIPTSFLLDRDGNVLARDLNAEDLDETLGQLLAQK
jgi:peroxiredoxin